MLRPPKQLTPPPMPPEWQRYYRRMKHFEMLARGGCIDTGDEPKDIVAWLDSLEEELSK